MASDAGGYKSNFSVSLLEDLARGEELFKFAISQKDVNFNDLYERLDDNTLLTTTTISDMNAVTLFCNTL